MLRTRYLVAAIASAMLLASTAQAADQSIFDHVVVFGDSLSDAGNLPNATGAYASFTTNPGPVAVENIASHYGFNLQPSRLGGSDYAYGGAGVNTNSDPAPAIQTLTQQVDGYLAGGARADSRSLYVVWGGANDIFYHATQYGVGTIFPGAGETAAQATAQINAAATQELALINRLKQAGAEHVVVFNLPNIGATPSAAQNDLVVPGIKGFLTDVSQSYNSILNDGLGDKTLAVNAYALFDQVLADPARYGFVNVTTPACTTSSSHDCDGTTLVAADADQTYLFADGVHPTTAAHVMLGQVVVSELQAPQQTSLLGEAPLAATLAYGHTLHEQVLKDSLGSPTRVFVDIGYDRQRFDASVGSASTKSRNTHLTLGYDSRASEHLSAGIALGVARHTAQRDGGGGFQLMDYTALGYVTYHAGGGYLSGFGHYGVSDFDEVERKFQIGAARIREAGSTDGSHFGLGIGAGWWFKFDSIQTGPFAKLDWQKIKVDGYREAGDDATAMWFGDQQRHALIGTAGWRLQGRWQVANLIMWPYAELAWSQDSKADDARTVTTGLNSMNGSFAMPAFAQDDAWGNVNLGLSAQLTPAVTSWIGYSNRFGDSHQSFNSYHMGFRFTF